MQGPITRNWNFKIERLESLHNGEFLVVDPLIPNSVSQKGKQRRLRIFFGVKIEQEELEEEHRREMERGLWNKGFFVHMSPTSKKMAHQ